MSTSRKSLRAAGLHDFALRSIASRAVDNRSWHFTITHIPSGIEVSGEVPKGNYSQKQMQQEKQKLFTQLWAQLELKVARHLRLPGW